MSEKKLSEVLQEKITALEKEVAEIKKTPLQSTTSTKPHTHSSNVVFDCPECQKEYNAEIEKQLRPAIEKELREKHKSLESPVLCKECGDVVEESEEECPTCHGKDARRI